MVKHEGYAKAYTFHKLVTAAGTPEKLVEHSEPCAQIKMKALRTNTGYIEYGFDGVETIIGRGEELIPKEFTVIPIDNVEKVWIDSTVNGDGVRVVVMV